MRSLITLLIFIYLPIFLIGQNDQIPNFGGVGQSFDFAGIVPTSDGFIGVANGRSNGQFDNDIILYQIDVNGEILGSSAIEKEGIQEVNTVIHFEDVFFIVGGLTDDQPTGEGEAYLMGFENDGTLAWELIYPGEKEDRILRGGIISQTEAVFLVGYESSLLDFENALIKVSKTGELLWEVEPNLMFPYDRITSIRGDDEGNILIMGVNNQIGFVRSYDEEGSLNWELNEIMVQDFNITALYDLVFDESQNNYLAVGTANGPNKQSFIRISKTGELLSNNISDAFTSPLSPGFTRVAPHRIIASPNGNDRFFVADMSEISEWNLSSDLSTVTRVNVAANLIELGPGNRGFEIFTEDNSLLYSSRAFKIYGNYDMTNQTLLYNNPIGFTTSFTTDNILKHSINEEGQFYFINIVAQVLEWSINGQVEQQLLPSTQQTIILQNDIAVLSDGKIALAYFEQGASDSLNFDLFDEEGTLIVSDKLDGLDFSYTWRVHLEALESGGFVAAYTNLPVSSFDPYHYVIFADENGNITNELDLSSLDLLFLRKMIPTNDQHLLFLSVTTETDPGIRVVKVDFQGNVAWDRMYDLPEFSMIEAKGLSLSPDGSKYAFSASVSNDDTGAIFWVELDTDGNISRSGLVDEQMSIQHRNSFIHYNTLGEILLFSSAHNCIANPDSEAYYMGYWKVDENDEVTELAKYFSAYPLVANDSELLADGRLSISGFERYWNEQDFFAVILDENGLVGVEDQSLLSQLDFRLSPNPTTGPLELSLNSQYQGPIRIAISDMNGQIIYSINTDKLIEEWQYEWDASHLPKGSYTVQIMTREGGAAKLWIRK